MIVSETRSPEIGGVNLQEIYDYLSDLRESGETNMFAAPKYLQQEFGLNKPDAFTAFKAWMEDFSE